VPDARTALASVTDALIALLLEETDRPWGDGLAPGEMGTRPDYPYGIVYSFPSGRTDQDAGRPEGSAFEIYQVTAVGTTRWSAQNLAGRAHRAIVDRTGSGYTHEIDGYTVRTSAGMTTATRSLSGDDGLIVWHRQFESSGGHQREGAIHNWVDRYLFKVSPV
jgi:hypothetical protein